MTLEKAIAVAEGERNSKVVGIGDCGDCWFFSFEDDRGKTDSMPLLVYKIDARCEYVCVGTFVDSLASGQITCTPVEIH